MLEHPLRFPIWSLVDPSLQSGFIDSAFMSPLSKYALMLLSDSLEVSHCC